MSTWAATASARPAAVGAQHGLCLLRRIRERQGPLEDGRQDVLEGHGGHLPPLPSPTPSTASTRASCPAILDPRRARKISSSTTRPGQGKGARRRLRRHRPLGRTAACASPGPRPPGSTRGSSPPCSWGASASSPTVPASSAGGRRPAGTVPCSPRSTRGRTTCSTCRPRSLATRTAPSRSPERPRPRQHAGDRRDPGAGLVTHLFDATRFRPPTFAL